MKNAISPNAPPPRWNCSSRRGSGSGSSPMLRSMVGGAAAVRRGGRRRPAARQLHAQVVSVHLRPSWLEEWRACPVPGRDKGSRCCAQVDVQAAAAAPRSTKKAAPHQSRPGRGKGPGAITVATRSSRQRTPPIPALTTAMLELPNSPPPSGGGAAPRAPGRRGGAELVCVLAG